MWGPLAKAVVWIQYRLCAKLYSKVMSDLVSLEKLLQKVL